MCERFTVFQKSKCSSLLTKSHGKMRLTKFADQNMFSVAFYCQS